MVSCMGCQIAGAVPEKAQRVLQVEGMPQFQGKLDAWLDAEDLKLADAKVCCVLS